MMKKILFTSTCLLVLVINCAAQDCVRHREPVGGFSICKPAEWTVEQREGQKYKVIFGPLREVFVPNLNFKDEANTAQLSAYVAASIKSILDSYQKVGLSNLKLVGQTDFMTTSETNGIRVALSAEYKGLVIRTLQYYFIIKDGQKLILTATALEADKGTLDPVFDGLAKSLQFE